MENLLTQSHLTYVVSMMTEKGIREIF